MTRTGSPATQCPGRARSRSATTARSSANARSTPNGSAPPTGSGLGSTCPDGATPRAWQWPARSSTNSPSDWPVSPRRMAAALSPSARPSGMPQTWRRSATVPDHRKYCNQVGQRLRDDLLAQLRTTRRPMSTSELRDKAPTHPLRAGSAVTVAPLQEQVYRALCVLRVHGKVEQHRSQGRTVSWVAAADTDADDEIADLEAAFQASPVPGRKSAADRQRVTAHLRAAA